MINDDAGAFDDWFQPARPSHAEPSSRPGSAIGRFDGGTVSFAARPSSAARFARPVATFGQAGRPNGLSRSASTVAATRTAAQTATTSGRAGRTSVLSHSASMPAVVRRGARPLALQEPTHTPVWGMEAAVTIPQAAVLRAGAISAAAADLAAQEARARDAAPRASLWSAAGKHADVGPGRKSPNIAELARSATAQKLSQRRSERYEQMSRP